MAKGVFFVVCCLVSITLMNSCNKNQVSKEPNDTHMTVLVNADTIYTPICTGQLSNKSVTIYGGSYSNYIPNNTYPFVYCYIAHYNPDSPRYYVTTVNQNVIRVFYSKNISITATTGIIDVSKITSTTQYFTGSFNGKVGDTTISCNSMTAETF